MKSRTYVWIFDFMANFYSQATNYQPITTVFYICHDIFQKKIALSNFTPIFNQFWVEFLCLLKSVLIRISGFTCLLNTCRIISRLHCTHFNSRASWQTSIYFLSAVYGPLNTGQSKGFPGWHWSRQERQHDSQRQ